MPDADEFSLSIWACMVMNERRLISERTKDAIAAARKRGVIWGVAGKQNLKCCNEKRIQNANEFAERLKPVVKPLRESGQTLQQIASALNQMQIKTPRGKIFTPASVSRVLERI